MENRSPAATRWPSTTKYLVAVGLVLVLLTILYLSRSVLGMIVAALIIAFLTYPIVRFLHTRLRFPRGLAALTTYILLAAVLALVPVILAPPSIDAVRAIRADAFVEWFQDQVENLEEHLEAIRTVQVFRFHLSLAPLVDPVLEALAGTAPPELASLEQVLGMVPSAFGSVTSILRFIATIISSVALALVFTFVMALYLSIDAPRIYHGLIGFAPDAHQPELRRLVALVAAVWSAYFRGQMTVGFLLGLITYVAAAIIGLPGAFILGLVAGVLNLIPNLGPVLSVIPAMIVALVQGSTYLPVSNLTFMLIVVALFALIQQLESNLITPRIVGHVTDLPPVVVIAGVVIGTATAGLLGAVLAAPVIATGRVVAAYALNKIFDRDPFFRLMPAPAEVIGWRDLLLRARHFILRLRFAYRYWRGVTPWDTNVTPPELLAFLDQAAPGRALDLGCGTGTNVITLAQHGWEATGVDFVRRAIRQAKRKAAQAGVTVQLLQADVTDLSMLTGPYDLALDIGCMASVPAWGREACSAGLARLVRPGGRFLLYSWLPRSRHGQIIGLSPDEVSAYLAPGFTVDRVEFGQDQGAGSAWYRLTRK